jgi:hypothetical protein
MVAVIPPIVAQVAQVVSVSRIRPKSGDFGLRCCRRETVPKASDNCPNFAPKTFGTFSSKSDFRVESFHTHF